MDTNEERVMRLLAEHFGLQPGQIQPSHSFTSDLGFDSLDAVEAVMLVEDNFGFQTTDAEAFAVHTVQALFDLVKSKASQ